MGEGGRVVEAASTWIIGTVGVATGVVIGAEEGIALLAERTEGTGGSGAVGLAPIIVGDCGLGIEVGEISEGGGVGFADKIGVVDGDC